MMQPAAIILFYMYIIVCNDNVSISSIYPIYKPPNKLLFGNIQVEGS